MNYKSFIELVRQECRFLEDEGFVLRVVDRNIWYEKHNPKEGYRISFFYTIYGNNFHVMGLSAYKRFNEVEEILQSKSGGDLIDYYTIHTGPDESVFPNDLPFKKTKSNFHFDIETSSQLSLFLDSVKKFYWQTAVPFFREYTSITQTYDQLSNLKNEELASLISGWNNLIFARVFIIKSFIQRSTGEEYYQYISKELSKSKGNQTIDGIAELLNNVREGMGHL